MRHILQHFQAYFCEHSANTDQLQTLQGTLASHHLTVYLLYRMIRCADDRRVPPENVQIQVPCLRVTLSAMEFRRKGKETQ